jgi:pimeloyl-ACP methyl ester carboxylesterase
LDTTLVLHSFTASLLPEIVSSGVRPKKIVLLEGILHSDDAIMAKSIVSMDNEIFQHWLKRFRSVSKMTLKSQLISKNHTNDLEEWSDSFKLVKGDALRVMASSLRQRLESDNIAKALTLLTIPQIYIRGENSRLSSACDKFLREKNMNIREIPKSAHFPMIDNPRDLAQLIIEEPL